MYESGVWLECGRFEMSGEGRTKLCICVDVVDGGIRIVETGN